MTRFVVQLHARHLPKPGVSAEIFFDGTFMQVAGPVSLQVSTAALEVTVGGFNEDTLFLSWTEAGVQYSAALPESARAELLASAPPDLLEKLKRGHNAVDYHRFKWKAVIAVLATVALLVTLALWQSEAITTWIAERIPLTTERRLGETVVAQMEVGDGLTQEGVAAQAVKAIGERLTKGSRYEYQWYIKHDASVNAFAIPGGFVVVHSGLIEKTASAEELAGVLAHEVQHVEHRHSLQQMVHSAGWAAVLTVVLGDVSAITSIFIHQLGNLHHSRKLESEADREGLKALARAGIPLGGMASFFRKLQADSKQTDDEIEIDFLSSHPATSTRLDEIDSLAQATPCQCQALTYDWASVKAALAESDPAKRESDRPIPVTD